MLQALQAPWRACRAWLHTHGCTCMAAGPTREAAVCVQASRRGLERIGQVLPVDQVRADGVAPDDAKVPLAAVRDVLVEHVVAPAAEEGPVWVVHLRRGAGSAGGDSGGGSQARALAQAHPAALGHDVVLRALWLGLPHKGADPAEHGSAGPAAAASLSCLSSPAPLAPAATPLKTSRWLLSRPEACACAAQAELRPASSLRWPRGWGATTRAVWACLQLEKAATALGTRLRPGLLGAGQPVGQPGSPGRRGVRRALPLALPMPAGLGHRCQGSRGSTLAYIGSAEPLHPEQHVPYWQRASGWQPQPGHTRVQARGPAQHSKLPAHRCGGPGHAGVCSYPQSAPPGPHRVAGPARAQPSRPQARAVSRPPAVHPPAPQRAPAPAQPAALRLLPGPEGAL